MVQQMKSCNESTKINNKKKINKFGRYEGVNVVGLQCTFLFQTPVVLN